MDNKISTLPVWRYTS